MRSLLHRLFDRPGTRAFDAAGAHRQMHHDQINAEHAAKSAIAAERLRPWTAQPPPAWFLPGPERMRGGAARQFASARRFHRGIHLEATSPGPQNKITR